MNNTPDTKHTAATSKLNDIESDRMRKNWKQTVRKEERRRKNSNGKTLTGMMSNGLYGVRFQARIRACNGFSVICKRYTRHTHTGRFGHTCSSLLHCCIYNLITYYFSGDTTFCSIRLYLAVFICGVSVRVCIWLNAACLEFLSFNVRRATLKCTMRLLPVFPFSFLCFLFFGLSLALWRREIPLVC